MSEQPPSKDLLTRLRNGTLEYGYYDDLMTQAADEIKRLQVIEKLYNEQCDAAYARGSAHEPGFEIHGNTIMTLAECVEAEGGFSFQTMPASDSPVTQQEVVSAIHHHASEIARLTAAWPAQPPRDALHCTDCRLLYSDSGWADFVVSDEVWQQIHPESGVLCSTCIFRRMHAIGIESAEGRFTGGPCAQHDWVKPGAGQ